MTFNRKVDQDSKMKKIPIITLTTDFGYRDSYVGSMKGVILSIHPHVKIVDLSHEIGPQDIREAAFLLSAAYRFFPPGTIHVVVVDPGVGSQRKILCAKTRFAYFLAPDNGVLTPVLRKESSFILREVSNPSFFRKEISSTFHGRDKFAPSAAHLSRRNVFNQVGPLVRQFKSIRWPEPKVEKKKISGEILHVDRFGNLITNIDRSHLGHRTPPPKVTVGGIKIPRWARFYAEGKADELIVLMNSTDYLEIALPHGSAAHKTGAKIGTPVTLVWP